MNVNAFVSGYPKISNKLVSEAILKYSNDTLRTTALWDTGATRTCIAKEAASALKLVPLGKQNMFTPSGPSVANTYLIDIQLPNNVTVPDIVVCDSEIGAQQIGVLIGMDIVNLGDFAVSNFNGKTVFSFRTPSQKQTDYVAEANFQKTIGPKHGKGKRKK